MIDLDKFKELLKMNFEPYIRQNGFKGSGLSFRKITDEHYIYTLKIQINKYGGSFCVEMGVFIDFIPNTINQSVLPNRVTPSDCDFRKRLSSSDNPDCWWNYGNDDNECVASINNMVRVFEKTGLKYFDQFNKFPNPLVSLGICDIANNSIRLRDMGAPLDTRLALLLARFHQYLGNSSEALDFCDWGLNNIGNATLLIADFKKIINEIRNI